MRRLIVKTFILSCTRATFVPEPIEMTNSLVTVGMKILKSSRCFRPRRAVGFHRTEGSMESNCFGIRNVSIFSKFSCRQWRDCSSFRWVRVLWFERYFQPSFYNVGGQRPADRHPIGVFCQHVVRFRFPLSACQASVSYLRRLYASGGGQSNHSLPSTWDATDRSVLQLTKGLLEPMKSVDSLVTFVMKISKKIRDNFEFDADGQLDWSHPWRTRNRLELFRDFHGEGDEAVHTLNGCKYIWWHLSWIFRDDKFANSQTLKSA